MNIDDICKRYNIKNYIINPDNSVDVNGNVHLGRKELEKLPLKFNKVSGIFDCSCNNLTSLEGAPKYVGGSFYCYRNNLTSFIGAPQWVTSYFSCSGNENLTSFEGFPVNIGKEVSFGNNPVSYIFSNYIKIVEGIELFNEFRIITNDVIHLNRFNDYCNLNNLIHPNRNTLISYGYEVI